MPMMPAYLLDRSGHRISVALHSDTFDPAVQDDVNRLIFNHQRRRTDSLGRSWR
jgi:hypothetical protein